MNAYYNEINSYCVDKLNALIDLKEITGGYVDGRDIKEVKAEDLNGFTWAHFFAGVGGWDAALKDEGWPAGIKTFTGSCPCQSFSQVGLKRGFDDPRHLYPVWAKLIGRHRPYFIFGEQVESVNADDWLALVEVDLEKKGYFFWPLVISAAGVGAYQQRNRVFFVAIRRDWIADRRNLLDNPASSRRERLQISPLEVARASSGAGGAGENPLSHAIANAGANDFTKIWAAPEFYECEDGRWRPSQPGICPLVDGLSTCLDEYKPEMQAFGNAIVPQAAQALIRAVMDEFDL